jgi:hypothetical protein
VLPEGSVAPDAVISMDAATMAAVGAGRRTIGEATADGAITIDGDLRAAAALTAAFEGAGAGQERTDWSAVNGGHVGRVVALAGGRGEIAQPSDLLRTQLDGVGGGVLLDAGDALGAGDRGDVVALGE